MDHVSGLIVLILEGGSLGFVLDVCILPFQVFDLMPRRLEVEKIASVSRMSRHEFEDIMI